MRWWSRCVEFWLLLFPQKLSVPVLGQPKCVEAISENFGVTDPVDRWLTFQWFQIQVLKWRCFLNFMANIWYLVTEISSRTKNDGNYIDGHIMSNIIEYHIDISHVIDILNIGKLSTFFHKLERFSFICSHNFILFIKWLFAQHTSRMTVENPYHDELIEKMLLVLERKTSWILCQGTVRPFLEDMLVFQSGPS